MKLGTMVHMRGADLEDKIRQVHENGFETCQICCWNGAWLTDEAADRIRALCETYHVEISTFWCGWSGPGVWDFAEGPLTLGLVPPEYRFARMEELKRGSDFAKRLGTENIATHVGFLPEVSGSGEYRAVWISYLELGGMLTGKTAGQFRSNIGAAYDNVKNLGCNTVIVHVRPFGDALYDSDYFPSSYLITGTEGDNLPFDPLKIMVEEAHNRGLTFEAWLNPYRVRARTGKALCSDNPARKYINSGSDAVYQTANGGIFYNPGSREAIDLIVNGVREIVRNYDVDAIHFDDYFYATTDSSIDSALYAANGGGKSLAAWRRQNVNTMVREVYAAVKAEKQSVRFGISPQGNTKANYDTLYADVATWLGNAGYVDYICPQIYYGFNNATCPYSSVLTEFNGMIKVSGIDLYVGLAAYKIGNEDTYAGTSGKYEWQQNSDLLSRMVTEARGASHYKGYCLYSYSSVIMPASGVKAQVQAELTALSKIL